MTTATELFGIATKGATVNNHRGVHLTWFVSKRPEALPLRFGDVIQDYDRLDKDSRRYSEQCISEMFTADEARAFTAWLCSLGEVADIIKIELPISGDGGPISIVPAGGGPNYLLIAEQPNYDLPFEVQGYFDTRFAEPLETDEGGGFISF